MSGAKFTDEFKRDAVAQVEDRGYPVCEVAERLGETSRRQIVAYVTVRFSGSSSQPVYKLRLKSYRAQV